MDDAPSSGTCQRSRGSVASAASSRASSSSLIASRSIVTPGTLSSSAVSHTAEKGGGAGGGSDTPQRTAPRPAAAGSEPTLPERSSPDTGGALPARTRVRRTGRRRVSTLVSDGVPGAALARRAAHLSGSETNTTVLFANGRCVAMSCSSMPAASATAATTAESSTPATEATNRCAVGALGSAGLRNAAVRCGGGAAAIPRARRSPEARHARAPWANAHRRPTAAGAAAETARMQCGAEGLGLDALQPPPPRRRCRRRRFFVTI